jgi:hypothetical protein
MTGAEKIARALGGGREKRTAKGWTTLCPIHEADGAPHDPSLDVDDGTDGRPLVTCRTGCERTAVLDALRSRGLRIASNSNAKGRTKAAPGKITSYPICDADGALQAIHFRKDFPPPTLPDEEQRPKEVWWARPGGENGLGGRPTKTLPLFGTEPLRAIADGNEGRPVIVMTEGEKPASSLIGRDIDAVGTACGGMVTPDDAALEPLRRFTAALWPDNDAVSRRHMALIAARLRALGAEPLRIDWPGAPAKGDAADWTGNGRTSRTHRSRETVAD